MNKTIVKNGKALRMGYTTGSCATAAAAAATEMLIGGKELSSMSIYLPNDELVRFDIEDVKAEKEKATCSVTKFAGDDPDVTDGIKIFAECSFCESGVEIKGGNGIGIVTGRGLKVPPGEAAINPVPRSMIIKNVEAVRSRLSCTKGISVLLSVPRGEEVAKRTFNARLGILGGISILGTSGIVEPMSERALIDTIFLLIDKHKCDNNKSILISPGNYGRDYCRSVLNLDIDKAIKFSNYIGETLDYLVYSGFEKLLLVGHVGKLIKLAGGIMNTHSSVADCRMEILAAHTALAGGDVKLVSAIMECLTTDEVILLLEENGLCEKVFKSIATKVAFHINYRTKGALRTEFIMFSADDKIIAQSGNASEFIELFQEKKEF